MSHSTCCHPFKDKGGAGIVAGIAYGGGTTKSIQTLVKEKKKKKYQGHQTARTI